MTLVLGFGDSSIAFERCPWTGPGFVKVASAFRVTVDETLADARIETPFPQRDLHLRTVDERVVFEGRRIGPDAQSTVTRLKTDQHRTVREKTEKND